MQLLFQNMVVKNYKTITDEVWDSNLRLSDEGSDQRRLHIHELDISKANFP